MPTDLNQWGNLISQGGLLGGSIAILYGYFKGIWLSGSQHARELAEKDKQLADKDHQLEAQRAMYEARIAQIKAEHLEQLKILRAERDITLDRARAREDKWERLALIASGLVEKLENVTDRTVNLVGLKQEGGG